MNLKTIRQSWNKLFAANTDAAAITAGAPTATKPSGDGVMDMVGDGTVEMPNNAIFSFFGERAAADNETFTARIEGWRLLNDLWIPVPLLALTGTLGQAVGVAGKSIINTEYFADTLVASGAYTSAYELISPADNSVALVKVDVFGCSVVKVHLAKGTNGKTNVLGAWF